MVKQIIDNQNEKAIESFGRMKDKTDVEEFKVAFKNKYQSDLDIISDEVDDLTSQEQFLEDLYEYNRRQIEQ